MADDPRAQDRPAGGEGHPPPPEPNFLDFLSLGTACALSIIVAGGLGYLIDNWLGTTPWLTFVGLAFGIVSAVLMAVHRLRPFL